MRLIDLDGHTWDGSLLMSKVRYDDKYGAFITLGWLTSATVPTYDVDENNTLITHDVQKEDVHIHGVDTMSNYFRVEYIKKSDGFKYWVNVKASTDIAAVKTVTNRVKCTIVKCMELCEVPYSYIESDEQEVNI